MTLYIIRRLLQTIPVFLGSTLLIFTMVFLLPGDPILALFGDKTPTDAQYAALQAKFHLDQPFLTRYLIYLGDLFQGDLGTTFRGQDVNEILARAFTNTLRLALLAIIIQLVFGVLVGLIAGLKKNSAFDHISLIVSLLLISMPVFVLAFTA